MTTLLFVALAAAIGILLMPSMAVVNTGLLTKGIRGEFFEAIKTTPVVAPDVSMLVNGTSGTETYTFLGSVPLMREMIGGRQAKDLITESFNVENLEYEATMEVKRLEVERDRLGQIMIRARELGQVSITHDDYQLADLLVHGASTGYLSYDKVTFFNASHVSGNSGAQSNLISQTAASTTKTTAEVREALMKSIARMMGFVDDQGKPVNLSASGLVVLSPPSLMWQTEEALAAAMLGGTSNIFTGKARSVMFPWLTSGTKQYLLKTDGQVRPFIRQVEKELEFTAIDAPDSETVFDKGVYKFGSRKVGRMAYGRWQYAIEITYSQ